MFHELNLWRVVYDAEIFANLSVYRNVLFWRHHETFHKKPFWSENLTLQSTYILSSLCELSCLSCLLPELKLDFMNDFFRSQSVLVANRIIKFWLHPNFIYKWTQGILNVQE